MKIVYSLIIASFLLASCNRNAYVTDEELIDFRYLEPISLIYEIDKYGITEFSDSLAVLNRDIIKRLIQPHAVGPVFFDNDSIMFERQANLDDVMMQKFGGTPDEYVQVHPTLQAELKQVDATYTLGFLSDGYQLTNKRYNRDLAESILVGVASGGSIVNVPTRESNFLYCVVFHNATADVVAFIPIENEGRDPVNFEDLNRQINMVLRKVEKRDAEKWRL